MDREILIVGGGVFGTSTAYHLALTHADPSSITILDISSSYPASRAASNDLNKIVRADYSNPFYMEMAYEAMDAWNDWPIFTKEDVYHHTGWLMFDQKGNKKLSEKIRENFRNSSRPDVTKDLTLEDTEKGWNGLLSRVHERDIEPAYSNPLVGYVDAAKAVEVMLSEAIKRGIKYEVGEATQFEVGGGGIKAVHTKDGKIYTAKKYLLATGAWTSQLISPLEDELGLSDHERIESQVTARGTCVVHFRLSDQEAELFGKLPIIVWGDEGEPSCVRLIHDTSVS